MKKTSVQKETDQMSPERILMTLVNISSQSISWIIFTYGILERDKTKDRMYVDPMSSTFGPNALCPLAGLSSF